MLLSHRKGCEPHLCAHTSKAVITLHQALGWTEGALPSITESILKVFLRMYTHTVVTNWLKYALLRQLRNSFIFFPPNPPFPLLHHNFSFRKSFIYIFLPSFTVSQSSHFRERYNNGDRNKRLTGWPLMVSSAVLATTESIFLTTPLQLLKLRHMNTKTYVPFRSMLYECLFARPPTVVRPS